MLKRHTPNFLSSPINTIVTKPHQHSLSLAVNKPHVLDLRTFLNVIILIDANSVDPKLDDMI
jgi:hypothetical protein